MNIVSKINVLSDRGIPKKKLQNGLSFKKFKTADPIWPTNFLKTNFEFLKTKVVFLISDAKNPRVTNFRRIQLIFKNFVRHFEFFQSK